jgi:NAD(P)H-hydrate epimerase
MISGKETKVLDINADFYGVPNDILMENAGKGISEFIKNRYKSKIENILIICGLGNNGGDGFVAARYLTNNYQVSVFITGKERDIKTRVSKKNFQKLKKTKAKLYFIESMEKFDDILSKCEIIVDAMLGIGLSGDLRDPYSKIVKKLNQLKEKPIISVDIPTGFGTNLKVDPDFTITFHDVKIGMKPENSGEIKIVDIGIPKKAIEYIGPGELKTFYPKPKKDSHKGDNGRVLIVGGGPYIGAPALSGLAALRTGADLSYIAAPKKVANAITSFSPLFIKPKKLAKKIATVSPNLIVKELNHYDKLVLNDVKIINSFISKFDTCIIGPGLGSDKETLDTIEKIINLCLKNKKTMVIDADAIQVVGKKPTIIKNSQTVITPHAGEFKELTGIKLHDNIKDRKKVVEKWANKLQTTILLKGPIDVISNGEITKLNDIHNPSMTVGGTGDVLAGIIGSLLSKDVEPFNAARIGAFINGSAGNISFEKYSYGIIATDIIDNIPVVLKNYL